MKIEKDQPVVYVHNKQNPERGSISHICILNPFGVSIDVLYLLRVKHLQQFYIQVCSGLQNSENAIASAFGSR